VENRRLRLFAALSSLRSRNFEGALLAAPLRTRGSAPTFCIAIAVSLAFTCSVAKAQTPAAKSSDAPGGSADKGKRAFTSAGCVTCHGAQAQGTAAAPQIAPPPLELTAMITYVRQPTGKMPPISTAAASDAQLADIYAFLKSVTPPATAADSAQGNAENGKKLFAADGCYECHGRQGAGAAIAPRIGPPAISLAQVLRYVRAPTGQMPPYTAKVISDQDLTDIFTYLKSLPPPAQASTIPLLDQ
jgi:mono/diheme cytochrome c family protein